MPGVSTAVGGASRAVRVGCPRCASTNWLEADALLGLPHCGRCGSPLFDGRPVQLTRATWTTHGAESDVPLLVLFEAPWSGACRRAARSFDEAAARLEPRFRLGRVNVEEEQPLCARLRSRALPCLAVFRGGHELARRDGPADLETIVTWAEAVARTPAPSPRPLLFR
ncbi:MAG: thioredoxin domain-containing protein [Thermodesulfobacteriota bacterium]|jgi:thioredoxin 2